MGLFITLTAPGRAVHHSAPGVVCACTPSGGVDLAVWNATAGKRYNRFLRDLSRYVGADVVWWDSAGHRRTKQGLAYFKAAEVQRRGALHFHVMARRLDGAPLAIRLVDLRRLAVKHGFGHSVDAQPLEAGHATYVAKYVSKAASERADVPWLGEEFHKPAPGSPYRVVKGEMVNTFTGELLGPARRVPVTVPRFRTWSAARAWGDTMAAVKSAQQHWVLVLAALPSWADRATSRGWGMVAVPAWPGYVVPSS